MTPLSVWRRFLDRGRVCARVEGWVKLTIAALAIALLAPAAPVFAQTRIEVASFNIQFLGQSPKRDNAALVGVLRDYDLVFVQEVIAPPYAGAFSDGAPFRPEPRVRAFFDLMNAAGFAYVMSAEDTGPGLRNHLNSSATEWFVAFYKPGRIEPAADLANGFIASDLTQNPDYDRVPHAFGFRAGSEDLVFISVHLRPGAGPRNRARRAHELHSIWAWISERSGGGSERDYVILGDMNIENCAELDAVLPQNAVSLNAGCLATNTNVRRPRPYDHVMFRPQFTGREIPGGLRIIDLVSALRLTWQGPGRYPGDPYNHDRFRAAYSDHDPISFAIEVDGADDD